MVVIEGTSLDHRMLSRCFTPSNSGVFLVLRVISFRMLSVRTFKKEGEFSTDLARLHSQLPIPRMITIFLSIIHIISLYHS